MCGIGFVVNYSVEKSINKIDTHQLFTLFTGLEDRGTDASGFFWERNVSNKPLSRTLKAPVPAEDLWDAVHKMNHEDKKRAAFMKKFRITGKERIIMLHTRKKTQGTETDNMNNMPIYNKDFVLIHNGMIKSERRTDYDYMGEVDSEEILANIEHLGLEQGIAKSYGSMAIVLFERSGENMFLYRRTNPLELLYMPELGQLWGASDLKFMGIPDDKYNENDVLFTPNINRVLDLPKNELFKLNTRTEKLEHIAHIEECKPTGYQSYGGKK